MSLIIDQSVPLYARVAQRVADDIQSGRYPRGAMLPPELQLCELFGVSRTTMRAAIRELQVRGMVSRRAGIGTRVEASAPQDQFVHESTTFEGVIQFTGAMTLRMIEVGEEIVNEARAAWLGCAPGEKLTVLRGVRIVPPGKPLCISNHFISGLKPGTAKRFDGLTGPLPIALESELGRRIELIRQRFGAINLGAAQAKLLDCRRGAAALESWRWYLTKGERLLMASNSIFPGDRYAATQALRRQSKGQ